MGQRQIQSQSVEVLRGEVGVLEPAQQAQRGGRRQGEQQGSGFGAPGPLNEQAEHPAQQDGQGHQKEIHRLAPAVEHQAEGQQNGVFEPEGHGEIQYQHRR